jgi:hypothetical protein
VVPHVAGSSQDLLDFLKEHKDAILARCSADDPLSLYTSLLDVLQSKEYSSNILTPRKRAFSQEETPRESIKSPQSVRQLRQTKFDEKLSVSIPPLPLPAIPSHLNPPEGSTTPPSDHSPTAKVIFYLYCSFLPVSSVNLLIILGFLAVTEETITSSSHPH